MYRQGLQILYRLTLLLKTIIESGGERSGYMLTASLGTTYNEGIADLLLEIDKKDVGIMEGNSVFAAQGLLHLDDVLASSDGPELSKDQLMKIIGSDVDTLTTNNNSFGVGITRNSISSTTPIMLDTFSGSHVVNSGNSGNTKTDDIMKLFT